MTRLALPLLLALLLVPFVHLPAWADETTAEKTDAAGDTAPSTSARLALGHLDLLPLGEFERDDLLAAYPEVAKRVQGLAYRIAKLEGRFRKREKKDDAEGKKLQAEIARLRTAATRPLTALTDLMRSHGLTNAMVDAMAHAPKGEGRIERYAHQLVLLLGDLDPAQRAIFERVVPEVDGAYLAARALHDRTELSLKQSGLEPRQVRGILSGFRRQTRVIESRFWRLVDYVLEDEQKATLWSLLPFRIRSHASPQDHVYALPTLSPTQGARVKALITEVEAESAPDQALVNRLKVAMRDKTLPKNEREALAKEQRQAYARLKALRRYAHETALEILTPAQVRLLQAVPPRVSANDRRRSGKQVLAGMTFDAAQNAALADLRKEGAQAAKAYRKRVKEAREGAGEIGPDSPQQMMMEMMMMSARGEVHSTQRLLLGRVFREILTPDQVSGWVMGLYGDRR